LINIGLKTLL